MGRPPRRLLLLHLSCLCVASAVCSAVSPLDTEQGRLPPGSLQALRRASRDDGDRLLVVVATLSAAMLPLFHNWRCAMHSNGLPPPPLLVFAQDMPTYRHVLSLGYPAIVSNSGRGRPDLALRRFRTSSYHALVRDRLAFLHGALAKGFDLLTVDVDAVWLRDPLRYIDRAADISAPLELQSSTLATPTTGSPTPTRGPEICACMLYLSSTPRVVALLSAALTELRDPKFESNEQKVLSYLLLPHVAKGTPWEGVTLKLLPKPEFPSGREYFGLRVHNEPGYNASQKARVAVVHNNWIISQNKSRRFKDSGMWYVRHPMSSGQRFECVQPRL